MGDLISTHCKLQMREGACVLPFWVPFLCGRIGLNAAVGGGERRPNLRDSDWCGCVTFGSKSRCVSFSRVLWRCWTPGSSVPEQHRCYRPGALRRIRKIATEK